jgi:uncharacterized membrane protein
MFHPNGAFSMVLGTISARAWYNIGLAVVLLVLLLACYWAYEMWQEVNEEVDPATADELMASFDQARIAGELDEEEYAKVRKRIEEAEQAGAQSGSSDAGEVRPRPPGPS